jgi:hypothetical protein
LFVPNRAVLAARVRRRRHDEHAVAGLRCEPILVLREQGDALFEQLHPALFFRPGVLYAGPKS